MEGASIGRALLRELRRFAHRTVGRRVCKVPLGSESGLLSVMDWCAGLGSGMQKAPDVEAFGGSYPAARQDDRVFAREFYTLSSVCVNKFLREPVFQHIPPVHNQLHQPVPRHSQFPADSVRWDVLKDVAPPDSRPVLLRQRTDCAFCFVRV